MFCPKCSSEFEAGHTRCDACDANLVEPLPVDEEEYTEPMTIFAGDSCLYDNPAVIKEYTDLVTVFVGEEGPADIIRAKLESCGIDAWVPTALTARFIFAPNVGPSTVQVRAEDAEAACQALAEVVVLEEGDESGEG
jgi:hypothetical protein